jgi:molybdopterin-containing oxidoreductase family membrane subunit
MPERTYVMGVFDSDAVAAQTITAMTGRPWRIDRVHSPIPSERIAAALKTRKSPVGWFTLAGGILGFFSGLGLAIFTALRWGLIVGGKPLVALVPFFIVGFEFTILFAVFGNMIGMLTLARLPVKNAYQYYDERLSGAHYGLLASCDPGSAEELKAFIEESGGEARPYDNGK